MKTQIITLLCCCFSWFGFSQSISEIEYFLNTDLGFGGGTIITANANSGNLTQSIPVNIGFLTGFNHIYFRVKDDQNVWSMYEKRVFYVVDFMPITGATNITDAEYFFNNDDLGFGMNNAMNINPDAPNITHTEAIVLPGTMTGFNSLYIRVKDDLNVWSMYEKRIFYVVDFMPTIGATNITDAEYFFNNDDLGFGMNNAIDINPDAPNITKTEAIILPGALTGFNSLYIRVKDDLGVWSLYEKRVFFVKEDVVLTIPTLAGAEYFYDSDPGFGNGEAASITPTGNPNEYTIGLENAGVTCDLHDFYIRLQNSDGTWGLYDYSFDLDIFDIANPTIVVFPNITAELDANGQASITLIDVNNGTFDDCDLVSVVLNQAQFDYTCANLGLNSVTITAEDAEAKVSMQDVDITVVDLINPIAIAKDITVQLDSNGEVTVTPSLVNDGSTDNCSVTNFSLDVSNFDCNDLGGNTVTLTAIDQSGNNSTNAPTATLTVEDNIKPTVNTQGVTVQLDASGNGSVTAVQIDNGSTDNCTINSRSLDISSFDCNDLGGNTVTLTVTDQSGNSETNTATVTVEDNINPTAIGQDISRDLAGNPSVTITAADVNNGSFDNCNFTLSIDIDTFTVIGVYPVMLTATDSSSNEHTVTVMVTIEDSLGIEDFEISAKNIKLYPVPTEGVLNISTKLIVDVLDIYDLSGKHIKKVYQPNKTVDISRLSTGIYFLIFNVENVLLTKRVIKK